LRRIKREATRNPLSFSPVIFQNCNPPGEPRRTSVQSVLRDMAKVRKSEIRPPLNMKQLKSQDWARKYLNRFFKGFMD